MKTVWIVLISVLATVIILALAGYFLVYSKDQSAKKDLQSQIDSLKKGLDECSAKTGGASSTSSSTTTSSKSSEANLAAAREVVTNYLNAKKTRSLESAKPYMTSSFYSSLTQDVFAGTSSPSMGRFVITSTTYLAAADLYQVKAKVYQNLNSVEVGYSENTYLVESSSGKFLVNEAKEGGWIETSQ